jgi:hypothetical protein
MNMPTKPWTKMTAVELAKATKEFDAGPPPRRVKPTAKELAKLKRASSSTRRRVRQGGPGRPPLGTGAVRVLFSIDPALLVRLDTFAQRHGMKRSHLITASVQAYMREPAAKVKRHERGHSSPSSSSTSAPVPLAALSVR